ncbi:RNA polymerase sigma factor [Pararhodonellum marinum]|uniref:RNA polymerase sigma factor n=1 Tax=Pararhodonellum marinum TaxID=2755358 RepID=UPI0018903787|nr:sigma-70 family RNA polymerase sigma factor [Pararhodonellum marinum]
MEHSDQKYILGLLNNDPVILEEIYRKYSGKIKWMVLKNNGTEADAADIFQEALITIFQKAKSENFVLTCPFDAFIYLICKKKWLNILNKKKNQPVTINEEAQYNYGEDSFRLAEDVQLHEDRLHLISTQLSKLGEACQELLHLSWMGKTMEEVASALGFTYGYARKKKSECMAKLVSLIRSSNEFNTLKW